MRKPTRRTETGRGERVVPGAWRLRLPLPLTGVPHCNAWALAAGDGIVLVDCGMDTRGSLRDLERALEQVGLALDDVRLLVCTHAHIDHCGQAATIQERTGCELWIHPRHEHLTAALDDRDAALARRIEIARQSGVPEAPLQAWAEGRREQGTGLSGPLRPARDLLPGVVVETDLGPWDVHETPGHAPCSGASRSTSTTAGRPTRSASSSPRSTSSTGSTCGCRCPATGALSPTCTAMSRATARS
jgi:glyoxylase-like metal-dependent hydrolase (beta-lactamase superfamily II)